MLTSGEKKAVAAILNHESWPVVYELLLNKVRSLKLKAIDRGLGLEMIAQQAMANDEAYNIILRFMDELGMIKKEVERKPGEKGDWE